MVVAGVSRPLATGASVTGESEKPMRIRNVSQAVVALAASVQQRRMRSHQREVGWPTEQEEMLFAEQRRRDLPRGHLYA